MEGATLVSTLGRVQIAGKSNIASVITVSGVIDAAFTEELFPASRPNQWKGPFGVYKAEG